MPASLLPHRGLIRITGADARTFLNGLVTCNVEKLNPAQAQFGALLSPQGKILIDFLLFEAPHEAGGGLYLSCARDSVEKLLEKLSLYKMRAAVTLEDLSDNLSIIAGWGDTPAPPDEAGLVSKDPRHPELGWQAIIAPVDVAEFCNASLEDYHAHRIACLIPEGGKDFLFADTFPHEANMDVLNGIDFNKGCYVGQEVVSRMHHRGITKKRILLARYPEGVAAEPGLDIQSPDHLIGKTGTASGTQEQAQGLVLVRVDRTITAQQNGEIIRAGGMPVEITIPDWAIPAIQDPE
jgi:folate-binding protein YgfZ